MKQRFLIILTVIVLLPIKLAAADTLTVEQKLVSEYSRMTVFRNQVWQNAAIRYDQRPFTLTDISVKGLYDQRGNAALAPGRKRKKGFQCRSQLFPRAESK